MLIGLAFVHSLQKLTTFSASYYHKVNADVEAGAKVRNDLILMGFGSLVLVFSFGTGNLQLESPYLQRCYGSWCQGKWTAEYCIQLLTTSDTLQSYLDRAAFVST